MAVFGRNRRHVCRRHVVAPVAALAVALLTTVSGGAGVPRAEAATCKYPAQILDLTNWKLQTPFAKTDGTAGIREIKQPALATYTNTPTFFNDPSKCYLGVGFGAPVNGKTTTGSKYPRSELREMTNNGRDNAAWSSTVGTHVFTETVSFNLLPNNKPDVVGAQIHNAAEDISLLVLRGKSLYVTDPSNNINKLVTNNYTLGTKVDMKWEVGGGVTRAYVNNVLQLTIVRAYDGAYFKAGSYPQANCTQSSPCSGNNGGFTIITKLAVSHSANSVAAAVTGPAVETLEAAPHLTLPTP